MTSDESNSLHDVERLLGWLRQLGQARVLVVGDAMLDRYVYGAVRAHQPRGAGAGAGGRARGRDARRRRQRGAQPDGPRRGGRLRLRGRRRPGGQRPDRADRRPAGRRALAAGAGRARHTTTKTRFIASGQHLLRADQEVGAAHPPAPRRPHGARSPRCGGGDRGLVLSDYGKGVLDGAACAAPDRRRAAPPGAAWWSTPRAATTPLCRRRPAHAEPRRTGRGDRHAGAIPRKRSSPPARAAGRARLRRRAGDAQRGRHDAAASGERVPSFPGRGARRCTTSPAPATRWSRRWPPALAARAAAAGRASGWRTSPAGIVVGKVGTAVAREDELLEALTPERGALRKVMSRAGGAASRWSAGAAGLARRLHQWLLRPAASRPCALLEQARSRCDRLVVGLNSDASVKRLKGAARPIQPEAARAAVLASLATVDLRGAVRRGHAGRADPRAAARRAGEGRGLHRGPGGRRRRGRGLGRPRGAGRTAARQQHHGDDRAHARRSS